MATSYIPNSDETFNTWQHNFVDVLTNSNPTTLGITAPEVTALGTASGEWETVLGDFQGSQNAARAARVTKDETRDSFETSLRTLVRRLQSSPAMNDALRASMGITIADESPTPNLAVPESRPMGTVDTSQRLLHTISYRDVSTPTRRAKPAGIKGCEVWMKIGTPPAEVVGDGAPADMRLLMLASATPAVVAFDTADGGKTAYYLLRWISTRNAKGPWSETVEATIVG